MNLRANHRRADKSHAKMIKKCSLLVNRPTSYPGSISARFDLSDSASQKYIYYSKVRFKFKWGPAVANEERHPVKYYVIFTPEDDPDTEDVDESEEIEFVGSKTIEWNGASAESQAFEIDAGTISSEKEGRYGLLKVDLDAPAFTLTTDSSKGILSIGNNYTSTPTTPEVERSADVRFIPKDFIESNSANISMGISSPDDNGGQVDVGSIDSSAFDSSGGVDPFKYLARTETLQNKDHDDPLLETQNIYFDLSFSGNTIFDAQETQTSSILEVINRFDFLYLGSRNALDHSEGVAAENAIDFVISKYGLSISEVPEYDPNLYDPAGSTDTIAGIVTGVRVGPLGFESERTLAGLMIHEETHVNQTVFERSSAVTGKRTYGLWVASGRLLPLTSYDVSLIYLYVGVEQEAILNEQTSAVYLQNMSAAERSNADNYWDEMEAIKSDLSSHGYTL